MKDIQQEENSAFNLAKKKRKHLCVCMVVDRTEKNEKLWGKYEKLGDTPIKNYWSKI